MGCTSQSRPNYQGSNLAVWVAPGRDATTGVPEAPSSRPAMAEILNSEAARRTLSTRGGHPESNSPGTTVLLATHPKRRWTSLQSVAQCNQKPSGKKNNACRNARSKTKQEKEEELCLPDTWDLHNNQSSKSCLRFLNLRLEKRYLKEALGSSSGPKYQILVRRQPERHSCPHFAENWIAQLHVLGEEQGLAYSTTQPSRSKDDLRPLRKECFPNIRLIAGALASLRLVGLTKPTPAPEVIAPRSMVSSPTSSSWGSSSIKGGGPRKMSRVPTGWGPRGGPGAKGSNLNTLLLSFSSSRERLKLFNLPLMRAFSFRELSQSFGVLLVF